MWKKEDYPKCKTCQHLCDDPVDCEDEELNPNHKCCPMFEARDMHHSKLIEDMMLIIDDPDEFGCILHKEKESS